MTSHISHINKACVFSSSFTYTFPDEKVKKSCDVNTAFRIRLHLTLQGITSHIECTFIVFITYAWSLRKIFYLYFIVVGKKKETDWDFVGQRSWMDSISSYVFCPFHRSKWRGIFNTCSFPSFVSSVIPPYYLVRMFERSRKKYFLCLSRAFVSVVSLSLSLSLWLLLTSWFMIRPFPLSTLVFSYRTKRLRDVNINFCFWAQHEQINLIWNFVITGRIFNIMRAPKSLCDLVSDRNESHRGLA